MEAEKEQKIAFPSASPDGRFWNEGMTLRDHFAGLAMQGMVQDSALRELFANKGNIKDVSWMDIMAKNAFFIADAMLKQREQ
jgi:hypothetical protein